MSRNLLPKTNQELRSIAHRMADGLTNHGPWLGLTDISISEFQMVAQALGDAETAFRNSNDAKELACKRVTLADRTLRTWLTKAKLVIKLARGAQWPALSSLSDVADSSAGAPRQMAERIVLARGLVKFFARHPEFGVPFADVTAARGRANYERLIQSNEMLQLARQECASAKRHRIEAERALRSLILGVVAALSLRIAPGEERWKDFGLTSTPAKRRGAAIGIVSLMPPSVVSRGVAAA
ncbi:MAG TPA: hypothetical protein VGM62_01395 [Chthoniobacterales bacterium]|jgi:hypothetical protein